MTTTLDQPYRKFTEVIDVSDWEVLTDTGWESVTHFNLTVPYDVWVLSLESGLELECADTHIVFKEDHSEIFVKDLRVGDSVRTQAGVDRVVSVVKTQRVEEMFDLTVDSPNHRYYINDVLSHNTTGIVAAVLHYVIFNDDKTIGILANKADTAREIMKRIQDAYENIPKWMQHGVMEFNKGSMQLENGSRIIAAASSSSSIRGKSINALLVDECAFVPNFPEFWASTFPTISSGESTKVVLISTPNGYNHFHKFWKEANLQKDKKGCGINGFYPIHITFRDIPERNNPQWEARERAVLGDEKFAQEHDTSFVGSVMTLISPTKLLALTDSRPYFNNENLKVYVPEVDPKAEYVLTADVSQGKGLDYSAFSVIRVDVQPYQQVATFRDNRIGPIEYGEVIFRAAKKFNDAHVLIELNDMGTQVARVLQYDLEYENVINSISLGRKGQVPCYWMDKSEPGVRTSKTTKAVGCNMLKHLVEHDILLLNDLDTIAELTSFVRSDRVSESYGAQEGKNDDTVTPLFLFGWLANSQFFTNITNAAIRDQLRIESDERISNLSVPIVSTPRHFLDEVLPEKILAGDRDHWFRVGGEDDDLHRNPGSFDGGIF